MKYLIALIIFFVFIGVTNSLAESLHKHGFELGAEISYIIYKEPDVMKEEGAMYGVSGCWVYHDKFMLKAEGKYSYGQLDYSSPISGDLDDIDDYMLECRGLGGYDFSVSNTTTITPYIGIGYRYLNDDLTGVTTTGARGYERESNYLYSPVGTEVIIGLENGWGLGATVEYDYFWQGRQKSHFSDGFPGFNDRENKQKKGHGLRGSIKIQKRDKDIDFIIEPFIRYWNIKKSEEDPVTYSGVIIGYGYEPKNNSTEYGLKFAVKF